MRVHVVGDSAAATDTRDFLRRHADVFTLSPHAALTVTFEETATPHGAIELHAVHSPMQAALQAGLGKRCARVMVGFTGRVRRDDDVVIIVPPGDALARSVALGVYEGLLSAAGHRPRRAWFNPFRKKETVR